LKGKEGWRGKNDKNAGTNLLRGGAEVRVQKPGEEWRGKTAKTWATDAVESEDDDDEDDDLDWQQLRRGVEGSRRR
jgi:hypothetical protein